MRPEWNTKKATPTELLVATGAQRARTRPVNFRLERSACVGIRAERRGPPSRRSCCVPFRRLGRSEEHTSELQSRLHLVCRLLLEKKKKNETHHCTQPTQPSSTVRSRMLTT